MRLLFQSQIFIKNIYIFEIEKLTILIFIFIYNFQNKNLGYELRKHNNFIKFNSI